MSDKTFLIYHNPNCTKSRRSLAFLEANKEKYNYEYDVILYHEQPPTREQLEKLSYCLGISSKEESTKPWKILLRPEVQDSVSSWDEAFNLIFSDPKQLERPFVIDLKREKAVLGRPDISSVEALVESVGSLN